MKDEDILKKNYVAFQAAVLRALPLDIKVDVLHYWTQNGELLTNALKGVLTSKDRISDGYPISVNYDRSVEDGVSAGQYDWSDEDINSKNFPTNQKGTKEVAMRLIHFNCIIPVSDVFRELKDIDCRPAEIHELLAFGEKYPEVQRQFPVIGIGSNWKDRDNDCHAPCLTVDGTRRRLELHVIEHTWSELYRFAAIPCLPAPAK